MAHRGRTVAGRVALGLIVFVLAACSSATDTGPNAVTSNQPTAGSAPQLGTTAVGDLSIVGVSVRSSGDGLGVFGSIRNSGGGPDELVSVGSDISPTDTLQPPLTVPPGAGAVLGDGDSSVQLLPSMHVDPGQTIALRFSFRGAGTVQVFATYQP